MADIWREDVEPWFVERMDRDYRRPYCWWGYHWSPPVPLSVVQLMQAGSLDSSLLALLWLMLGHRASLAIAAQPPVAGKTTTLTALLEFLPPGTERVYLRGLAETFHFVGQVRPEGAYLLCNEISPDLPTYMWGRKAAHLFELMGEGYPLVSTMHADSVQEVVGLLEGALKVPRPLVARLTLVLVLDVSWAQGQAVRRARSLHLLRGKGINGLELVPLAQRGPAGLRIQPEAGLDYLASCGLPPAAAQGELRRRARFLEGLLERGLSGIPQVREAIEGYSPGFTGRGGLGG